MIKAQACNTSVSHLAIFVSDRFDYNNTSSPLARSIHNTATMSEQDGTGAAAPGANAGQAQIDNALRALREKKPAPEIDFTLHTMEDGSQVNTMERVCKGAH